MECNKDEAIRAKKIAENKMMSNDFEGARKIALKARRLFPELENISQLLAVCDVHCSAQRKIHGADKDLYGILQVESLADEATIRKQYRRLALVLHPDKNKFPGAEAAFKLIGEANMILSDKGKRSLHDIKCREPARPTVPKPQNHQGNQNPYGGTQFGAQNKYYNVPSSQFGGMNHRQQSHSESNGQPSFWTYCPFCKTKYQYYRDLVNRPLRCQNCSKLFIAYDMGAPAPHSGHAGMQNVNLGSNRGGPVFSQQEEVGRQGNVKVDAQRAEQFSSHFAYQTCSSTGVQSTRCTRTEDAEAVGNLRSRMEENGNINTEGGKEGVAMPKADAEKPREARIPKDTNRKRGRKMVVESSGSSPDVEVAFEGTGGNPRVVYDSNGRSVNNSRRSSRKRPQVSYREEAGDDSSTAKRSRPRKLSSDVEDTQHEEAPGCQDKVCNTAKVPAAADVNKDVSEPKASAHAEGSMPNDKFEEKHKLKGEGVIPNGHSKSNSDSEDNSEPLYIDCPDLEFSNFDKDKEEHCFAVDQIWACYDTLDGMPRFYAQVKKVYSTGFRLRITWLEADPENHLEIIWAEEGLPVACGKFMHGDTEETRDRLMFSHQIVYEKGKTRFSYAIYPNKGEIWALFKDWDINWISDPESHTKYKFDIVEVLSDFDNDNGVLVAYMVKVEGFVSLFQKTSWARPAEHRIPPSELFRFSHRIPSVKLTGAERADVPVGSCELDTASLPDDLDEYYFSNKVKVKPESISAQTNDSCPQSPEAKVKPTSGSVGTPKKLVKSEGKNDFNREMLNLRRSPRGLKGADKNHNQEKANPCSIQEGNLEQSNGVEDEINNATPSTGNNPFWQDDDVNTSSNGFAKSPELSSPSGCREAKLIIHDFNMDKQNWKFQEGQIWALCRSKDGNLRCYAQIKKIESSPLRLHVDLLELCTQSNNAIRPNACGLFKASIGRRQIFPPDSFLYLVKAEVNGKNRFNIYPREKEIWVLCNKQDSKCTLSDLDADECDIVEVLENSGHVIKVLSLSRVPGYKSVFRALEIQNSKVRVLEIPRAELNRFSYRVPAFLLTEEQDGRLRGCWELDLAEVPGLPSS